ncbi:hypothetical protein Cni_G24593 [Canna indica]|uniref:Uncharacterized protein n=1 Tax=Canna indica TaxID=4628 RepID=A0AAQ3L2N7_9LILI|nr:hypothetical protein Cni_G24593 [Canna indica]
MEKDEQGHPTTPKQVPKKRSSLSIFRAALHAMIGCSAANKKDIAINSPKAAGADGVLKTLVSGVRPLTPIQLEQSSPSPLLPPPPPESFHDVMSLPPASPTWSSVDCTSRYASAVDLQALDVGEDEGDAEVDAGEGSGEINVKADEFIANFYEQMRLQRVESFNGINQETEQVGF